MVQQAVHSSYYCIRSCPMNQRKGGWKCAGKGALSSVKEFNTGPLYPDLVGEKATRFYGYQCAYGQHMTNSRLYTQVLSMRSNFWFIHCFMPSKKWGVFLEINSFRQCVCIWSSIPSNSSFLSFLFFFFWGRQFCGNPFRLVLDSFQPIAEFLLYTKWSIAQNRKDKPPQKKKTQISSYSEASKQWWTFWTSRIKSPQ